MTARGGDGSAGGQFVVGKLGLAAGSRRPSRSQGTRIHSDAGASLGWRCAARSSFSSEGLAAAASCSAAGADGRSPPKGVPGAAPAQPSIPDPAHAPPAEPRLPGGVTPAALGILGWRGPGRMRSPLTDTAHSGVPGSSTHSCEALRRAKRCCGGVSARPRGYCESSRLVIAPDCVAIFLLTLRPSSGDGLRYRREAPSSADGLRKAMLVPLGYGIAPPRFFQRCIM